MFHRDVKPSNLLVDARGAVWMADFGLARRLADPSQTQIDSLLGTPRYMSPEQARTGPIDGRSDVYSLGATLYELLTLRPPFEGKTAAELIEQIAGREPVSVHAIDPRVPRDLETIVLKALHKRPGDRYASAAELAEDLERYLNHEPVRARRIGPLGRAWRVARRHPSLTIVSTAATIAVLSTVTFAYARVVHERDQKADANERLKKKSDALEASEREYRTALFDALRQNVAVQWPSGSAGRREAGLAALGQAAELAPGPAGKARLRDEAVAILALRDVADRREIPVDERERAGGLVLDAKGRHLAALSVDGNTVRFFDVATRALVVAHALAPDDAAAGPPRPPALGRGGPGRGPGFRAGPRIVTAGPDVAGHPARQPRGRPAQRRHRRRHRQAPPLRAAARGRRAGRLGRRRAARRAGRPPAGRAGRDRRPSLGPDGPRQAAGHPRRPGGRALDAEHVLPPAPGGDLARRRDRRRGRVERARDRRLDRRRPGPDRDRFAGARHRAGPQPGGAARRRGQPGPPRLGPPPPGRLAQVSLTPDIGRVDQLRFDPENGALLGVGGSSDVELWDVAALARVARLPTIEGARDGIPLALGGKTLALGLPSSLALWSVVDPKVQVQIAGFRQGLGSLAFSPSGELAMATGDGDVRLWSLGHCPTTARPLDAVQANALAFDAAGRLLAPGRDPVAPGAAPGRESLFLIGGDGRVLSRTALPRATTARGQRGGMLLAPPVGRLSAPLGRRPDDRDDPRERGPPRPAQGRRLARHDRPARVAGSARGGGARPPRRRPGPRPGARRLEAAGGRGRGDIGRFCRELVVSPDGRRLFFMLIRRGEPPGTDRRRRSAPAAPLGPARAAGSPGDGARRPEGRRAIDEEPAPARPGRALAMRARTAGRSPSATGPGSSCCSTRPTAGSATGSRAPRRGPAGSSRPWPSRPTGASSPSARATRSGSGRSPGARPPRSPDSAAIRGPSTCSPTAPRAATSPAAAAASTAPSRSGTSTESATASPASGSTEPARGERPVFRPALV